MIMEINLYIDQVIILKNNLNFMKKIMETGQRPSTVSKEIQKPLFHKDSLNYGARVKNAEIIRRQNLVKLN